MAATTRVPLDVYLHTDYEPAPEYVDGVLEERYVGENKHSAWQAAIAAWFVIHAAEWRIGARTELHVQTLPTHFRLPDVAVLDAPFAQDPIATYAPLAVFEILSPDDRYTRLMVKLREYARMGVAAIYVLDPETGEFERFEQGQLVRREEFSLPERGIEFRFREIAKLVM